MSTKKQLSKEDRKLVYSYAEQVAEIIEIQQSRPWTYVAVGITVDSMPFRGIGFSKVCWPDAWDANAGIDRAARRAMNNVVSAILNSKTAHLYINSIREEMSLDVQEDELRKNSLDVALAGQKFFADNPPETFRQNASPA